MAVGSGGTNSVTALANGRVMISDNGKIIETTAMTNGQLLIGASGTFPTASTLTAATGISVTNGAGSITLQNTGLINNLPGTGISISTAGGYSTVSLSVPVAVGSGGTNSVTALANGRVMISDNGKIIETTAMTNGQLLIGASGTFPTASTLTAATGISVTNGAGSITLQTTGLVNNLPGTGISISTAGGYSTVSLSVPVAVGSGGTNSVTALANGRVMISNAGRIVETTALTNGQLLIGASGTFPTASTLTAGSNITITNASGSITIASTSGSITPSTSISIYDDFMYAPLTSLAGTTAGLQTGGDTHWWQQSTANGGSSISPTTVTSNEIGVVSLSSVTSNNNGIMWSKPSQTFQLGKGVVTIEYRVNMTTAPSVTNDSIGFGLAQVALPTTLHGGNANAGICVMCRAVRATADPTWQLVTSTGTQQLNQTGSGTNWAANTWTKLILTINAAASSVSLSVDGTTTYTNTSQIPLTSTLYPFFFSYRGNSTCVVNVDYCLYSLTFTTPR